MSARTPSLGRQIAWAQRQASVARLRAARLHAAARPDTVAARQADVALAEAVAASLMAYGRARPAAPAPTAPRRPMAERWLDARRASPEVP